MYELPITFATRGTSICQISLAFLFYLESFCSYSYTGLLQRTVCMLIARSLENVYRIMVHALALIATIRRSRVTCWCGVNDRLDPQSETVFMQRFHSPTPWVECSRKHELSYRPLSFDTSVKSFSLDRHTVWVYQCLYGLHIFTTPIVISLFCVMDWWSLLRWKYDERATRNGGGDNIRT